LSEAPSVVFATALVDVRAGESAVTRPAFRDALATYETTSVVPLLRNHHVCSASSLVTNNPTNAEPTCRRQTSTDLEETGSDRARRFAHNRQHADPEARERIDDERDRPRRRRQPEPPDHRVTLRPRSTSMKLEAELMTVQDVSRCLRVPVGTLRNWRVTGDGPPAARIGRHVRYRQADVEAWVSERVRLDIAQRSHEG
jgi:excisionase family DNA binding protein